jgi:hypothetical protein
MNRRKELADLPIILATTNERALRESVGAETDHEGVLVG